MYSLICCLQMWEFINVWPDINEMIDCVPNIVISVVIAVEYTGIFYNSEKVKKCLDRIAQDWQYMSSKAEMDLLRSYTVHGQKLAKIYLSKIYHQYALIHNDEVYMSITGFLYLLQPFLITVTSISDNSTDILSTIPYRVQYGIDLSKYYYEVIVHCYVTVVAHMGILCSINLIYILFIQHACGLFAVIGYKLQHLGEEDSLETSQNIEKKNDTNYWIALECLRRHVEAIEFSEYVEGTFSTIFLCTLGLYMLALAIGGTQVLLHLNDVNEAVRYVSLSLAILIQLFWLCWQAQLVLDYSNMATLRMTEGEWYKTSTRCKKILILIMIRSSKPCAITAGRLIALSIETFGSVLRTSMSYFTVLQSMQ